MTRRSGGALAHETLAGMLTAQLRPTLLTRVARLRCGAVRRRLFAVPAATDALLRAGGAIGGANGGATEGGAGCRLFLDRPPCAAGAAAVARCGNVAEVVVTGCGDASGDASGGASGGESGGGGGAGGEAFRAAAVEAAIAAVLAGGGVACRALNPRHKSVLLDFDQPPPPPPSPTPKTPLPTPKTPEPKTPTPKEALARELPSPSPLVASVAAEDGAAPVAESSPDEGAATVAASPAAAVRRPSPRPGPAGLKAAKLGKPGKPKPKAEAGAAGPGVESTGGA